MLRIGKDIRLLPSHHNSTEVRDCTAWYVLKSFSSEPTKFFTKNTKFLQSKFQDTSLKFLSLSFHYNMHLVQRVSA